MTRQRSLGSSRVEAQRMGCSLPQARGSQTDRRRSAISKTNCMASKPPLKQSFQSLLMTCRNEGRQKGGSDVNTFLICAGRTRNGKQGENYGGKLMVASRCIDGCRSCPETNGTKQV
jgi:hypothetical protein